MKINFQRSKNHVKLFPNEIHCKIFPQIKFHFFLEIEKIVGWKSVKNFRLSWMKHQEKWNLKTFLSLNFFLLLAELFFRQLFQEFCGEKFQPGKFLWSIFARDTKTFSYLASLWLCGKLQCLFIIPLLTGKFDPTPLYCRRNWTQT